MLVLRGIALCLTLALTVCQPAFCAHGYTETWSDEGDVEGWYPYYGGDLALSHNDLLGTLEWDGPNPGCDFINADFSSSSGAFVGDLRPFEGGEFTFDLYVNPGGVLSDLILDLYDDHSGQEWQAHFRTPVAGVWTHYKIYLLQRYFRATASDGDWQGMLEGCDETSLLVEWQGGTSGQLDNFGLKAPVPEPGTAGLMGVGLAALWLKRRRRG